MTAPVRSGLVNAEANVVDVKLGSRSYGIVIGRGVVATLGAAKTRQWVVGFALETEDRRLRALAKLEKKHCNLMVLNGPDAMNSLDNQVEILDSDGHLLKSISGRKEEVARGIFAVIEERLIRGSKREC